MTRLSLFSSLPAPYSPAQPVDHVACILHPRYAIKNLGSKKKTKIKEHIPWRAQTMCLGPFLSLPFLLSPMHPVAGKLEPKNSIKRLVSKEMKKEKKKLTTEAQATCLGQFSLSPASPSKRCP